MSSFAIAFPRLALPFTIIECPTHVQLVGGEDVRFTLRTGESSAAMARMLRRCDGRQTLDTLLAGMTSAECDLARRLLSRLRSERVLVEGAVESSLLPLSHRLVVEGVGELADRIRSESELMAPAAPSSVELRLLVQEDLNLRAAYEFNRRLLRDRGSPWVWLSVGPAARGYVSPVFLPAGGPCLGCLLRNFQRLSPVPALYDDLARHGADGGDFSRVSPPETVAALLCAIVRWKCRELANPVPSSAAFRLHVVESATHEVSLHRVFADPTCTECGDGELV